MNAECSTTWGKRNESLCLLADPYPVDTGVYWCESGAGECSSAVNITVTGGSVILESPVLPVPEGENVTLRCTNKMTFSSNITAEFYKNGLLIGNSSSGNLSILSVLKSDEGLYKCSISGAQSPDSWLAVRAGRPESFHSPLAHILLPVVGVCLLLVVVILLLLWRSRKGKINSDVSYTDVTITQEVQPNRDREIDDTSTFYSLLKPGATREEATEPVLKSI
ncbi:low affinity immunoglobulin gamma Fc region receptor II-b-like isoform X3 [Dicentrarchus labrax]|nr:low affinity immunoglobulin gamma Fc region receptor II-b-like isoform X3 [Dicentrarchus labrax]XP_051256067.1 low affinity immunoglobulin gamma Fc region receptor II-b-like isoform X3 [Dicentrarchus labrax]XP_051256068.1 low affinity immunoglobulin gamma Fc region receptor II-b-like isoform X3 [Dicentrarchus labrax]